MSRRTTVPVLVAAALLVGAAACSDDDGADPAPSSTTSTTEPIVSANVPTSIPDDPDVRRNVVMPTCEATDDGWRAAGTVANPGEDPASVTITVFFTTEQATVIGTGDTTVDVEPGGSADWSIAPAFTAPDEVLCVLVGAAPAA